MAQEFSSILTIRGRQKVAAALAGGAPVQLTHMAVGDGRAGAYYSPSETQVALENEVFRAPINHLYSDPANPAWAVSELVIPDDVGGFYVREAGVFDSDGELFCIGKFPESFKPLLSAGAGKQLYVRQMLEVSNAAAVTLIIDPSIVMATRQFVDERVDVAVSQITDRINSLDAKNSVRVATTAPIALSGIQTIDGVALAAGNRVLVKDQPDAQNGIYRVNSGAWTRADDANTSAKVTPGLFVPVEEGIVGGSAMYQLVTPAPITLGTTPLQFVLVAGKSGVTAGTYNSFTLDARGRITAASQILVPRYLNSGNPLPNTNIGPIWHNDYNDWMTWQVFNQNGANYAGYASRLVGAPLLDAQATPRAGYVPLGSVLSKTAYEALWAWAVHNGIQVASGVWVQGSIAVKDNGDGTFTSYDLRGEFPRFWDAGRGVDSGRAAGTRQGDAIRDITGFFDAIRYSPTNVLGGSFNLSIQQSNMGMPGGNSFGTGNIEFAASRVVPTAAENRPRNTAMPGYIKF